jgi:hypothetical protein
LQNSSGGFPGENKAWESSQEERESSAGKSKAWEGATGNSTGNKGLAGASEACEGPQEQYCSSCNRKKPLIDFGWFFTYNIYRERNKKANRGRYTKQKAKYLNKSS